LWLRTTHFIVRMYISGYVRNCREFIVYFFMRLIFKQQLIYVWLRFKKDGFNKKSMINHNVATVPTPKLIKIFVCQILSFGCLKTMMMKVSPGKWFFLTDVVSHSYCCLRFVKVRQMISSDKSDKLLARWRRFCLTKDFCSTFYLAGKQLVFYLTREIE